LAEIVLYWTLVRYALLLIKTPTFLLPAALVPVRVVPMKLPITVLSVEFDPVTTTPLSELFDRRFPRFGARAGGRTFVDPIRLSGEFWIMMPLVFGVTIELA
jgi:hypothetical protein